MTTHTPARWLTLSMIAMALAAGQGIAQNLPNLGSMFQMMGGMDSIKKLSTNLLQSAVKDPRLTGLLGTVDPTAASPKLADQMCSMLGGGCKAPLSEQQIAAGSGKLDTTQTE